MKNNYFSEDLDDNDKKNGFVDLSEFVRFIVLAAFYYIAGWFLTKKVILPAIMNSGEGSIGNNIISLMEVHNKGAAFNLFQAHSDALTGISFFAILIIIAVTFGYSAKLSKSCISAIAFLFSGIILNLQDRIAFGYVIDFIQLGIIPSFPSFNIADIMIVAGALGIISALFNDKKQVL